MPPGPRLPPVGAAAVRARLLAWWAVVRPQVEGVTDLLLGGDCAGCRSPGASWCARCHAQLRAGVLPERHLPAVGAVPLRVAAAAPYVGAVREALVAHKDHGRWALARPLAAGLADAVEALLVPAGGRAGEALLVPVPSSARAVRRRGYDHGRSLARQAAAELRRRGRSATALPVLELARGAGQVGLGAQGRLVNRDGSMVVCGAGDGGALRDGLAAAASVVVVDDIVTTGASLREASRALHAGGVTVVGAAVVAAVPGPAPARDERQSRRAVSSPPSQRLA